MSTVPTRIEAMAQILGCTPEQVKAQLAKNAKQLRSMEAEAIEKGRKVNGYTASDLGALAQSYEERSV